MLKIFFLFQPVVFLQRGDVERGEEEEEETSSRRGRQGSRASQRSRPSSTARPVVSKVYFPYRLGLLRLLFRVDDL
jgi:hypothetical protein